MSYFWKASIAFIYLYLVLAVLGLCCCAQASLATASGGYSLVAVWGLLMAEVSLVAEHGLRSCGPQA